MSFGVRPYGPFTDKVQELRECEFAGEIALTAEELRELAVIVRLELNSRVPAHGARERLILAAVNCAYFYMDAQGFWRPFCRLLEMEFCPATQCWIGGRIEEALLHLGLLDQPGYGAFRYVTPVRMQAGLTRYDIPIFARLLEEAREAFGWAALQTQPDDELAAFLDAAHPAQTKFIIFLKDPLSGARLLRDVVRHLVLWRQGLIDEPGLNALRGYRPGFWSELLAQISRETRTARLGSVGPPPPVFFFDEYRGECGLLFSRELVNRRTYRLDGEVVRESFHPLRELEDFREEFSVEAGPRAAVRVAAWRPSEGAPYALFKSTGEYLARDSAVHTGSYLLVAIGRSTLPESIACDKDFEFCATPELRFWHVEIDGSTELAALGYARSYSQTSIRLEWAERVESLAGVSDASEVFLGCLPTVRVSPTRAFRDNRAALCWSACGKTGRVHVAGDAEDAIVDLPVSAPCRGEVWIEPLGRERAENALPAMRLSFCVLPECAIAWPCDLYAEDDEPRVEFSAIVSGVECEFPDCTRVANAEAAWSVPAGANWIEGEVEAGEVAVRVVQRIHRATAENANSGELWLKRSALGCDDSVRVRGLPKTPVHLELDAPDATIDIPLHQAFNEHGVALVRCWDFHDRLSVVDPPVHRICVHGMSGPVPTLGRIVDLSALERIMDDARQPNPDWRDLLGDGGGDVLRRLAEIIAEPQRAAWPDSLGRQLPAFFTKWARSLFACACVLNASRPAPALWRPALDEVPAEVRKTLDWVLNTDAALAGGGDLASVSSEFAILTWEPPLAAWRSFLAEMHARVRAEHDLVPLVAEWRDEVKRCVIAGTPGKWKSILARMPGGAHLSEAFLQNLRSVSLPAIRGAYHHLVQIDVNAPPLVHSLARLLKELLLKKFGGTDSGMEPLPIHCHRLLRPLLTALLPVQGGAFQPEDSDAASALPLDLLPLRKEDRELIESALRASHSLTFTQ